MSYAFKNKAADYQGVEGLYIPDHVTDIVISEAINCSTLAKISNPAYTIDRKSTRLNSSHSQQSRMPSSA